MATYIVNDYDSTNTTSSLKTATSTANGSTANDTITLSTNITLTPDQTAASFSTITPNGSGTLRFRSVQPTPAIDPPVMYTLTLTNAVNIIDNNVGDQPSFTIGPVKLQIGDGINNGSLAGNLRADDGGVLIFNNTTNTTYTGTLSVEDEDNGLFNAQAGTTVTLDGTAGTNGLAIRASQNPPTSTNPNPAANAYELEFGGAGDGVISGIIGDSGLAATAGKLDKIGAGTWTFSGTNTYVGTTTVEQGTLVISNSAGLGATLGGGAGTTTNPATAAAAGTIVSEGATLALTGGIAIGQEALTLGAPGDDDAGSTPTDADEDTAALLNLSGNNSFAGNITLAGDAIIESDAGKLTLTGAITGAGAVNDEGNAFNPALTLNGDGDGAVSGSIDENVSTLTKDGDGTWTLSGANAYIGTTTVEEGTLVVANASALGSVAGGTVVEDGATLSLDGSAGNLAIGTEALTLSGQGAAGDDPGEGAAGALSNEAGDNSFAGDITLAADSTIKSEAGSLTLTGAFGGAFGLTLDGDANGTISGNIAAEVTTVTKNGGGTWDLSGLNAYAGGTFLNEGTLELGTMASAGTGAITFGDDEQTLRLDASGTLANVLTNFEEDDTIDLRTIDSDGATYTINGNKLTITEAASKGTDSVTLTFDGDIPSNFSAVLNSDGQGGTTVTLDDITAPDTPEAPTLTASSDTGTSTTDRVTRDDTPTFTGMAEAGSTVTLYDTDGQTALGSAVAGEDGTYTVTASHLTDGAHTISVTATDDHGNVSDASAGTVVTIDTVIARPTLSLAAVSDSGRSSADGITKVTTPVINGTGEANSVVSLFDGTKVIGSATVGANGTFSLTAPVLADGVHNLSAVAVDAAGNFSLASPVLSVTIDTKAPVAPAAPTLAAASDSGSSSTDRITNIQAPTFTGTAEAGSTITLYDGTKIVGSALVGSRGTYSVTASTLAAGAHAIKVTATDAAGNVGPASVATTITIDTTAPTAPLAPTLVAASDTGRSATDALTNDSTPTLTGKAEAGATVRLYDGNGTTVLGTAVAAANGVYTVTSSTLSDGQHSLTVSATDAAGNTGARSAGKVVTIDTTAPNAPTAPRVTAASDSGRSQTDGITNDATPTVTGQAEAGSTVTLYQGTIVLGSAAVVNGTYTITSMGLGDYAHHVTVKATDAAGNVSAASPVTTVTIDTVAPVAPGVALANDTGDSATDGLTKDPTLRITSEAGASLLYSTDNKTFSANAPVFATNGTADGAHTVYVRAVDAAGNTGPSASRTFTLDTKAPAVSITNTGGNVTQASQIINGTGEAGTSVLLYDNNTVVGVTTVAANGKWSKSVSLSQGSNQIVATDFDKAGNMGTSRAVNFNYNPASLNNLVQAMSTTTNSSSASMSPSASSSGSEAHPLAAAHG